MTASNTSTCTHLSTRKPESIAATLCTTSHGNWILQITSLQQGYQPVVRVRLTGPEVLQAPVQYCEVSSYATFALFTPGQYHLEIMHLYKTMDVYHPGPVEEDLWLYWGHMHVDVATAEAAKALTACGPKRPDAPACKPCGHGVHTGRWRTANQSLYSLALEFTCAFNWVKPNAKEEPQPRDATGEYIRHPFDGCDNIYTWAEQYRPDVFRWVPDHCTPASPLVVGKSVCQQQLNDPMWHACFVGDSHVCGVTEGCQSGNIT